MSEITRCCSEEFAKHNTSPESSISFRYFSFKIKVIMVQKLDVIIFISKLYHQK